jgi:hypothetical protein
MMQSKSVCLGNIIRSFPTHIAGLRVANAADPHLLANAVWRHRPQKELVERWFSDPDETV